MIWFSVTADQDAPSSLYSNVPVDAKLVILIDEKDVSSASASEKEKSETANCLEIFWGVLSPDEDTWLFSLI